MATYTIMRLTRQDGSSPSLSHLLAKYGVQKPEFPIGFVKTDSLEGEYEGLCYLHADLKEREVYSQDQCRIIRDEDCAPTIRKAYIYDLSDERDGIFAIRGAQGMIDHMISIFRKEEMKMEGVNMWPNDFAEWLVGRKGCTTSSYRLEKYPIANGKLEATGVFNVIGEQGVVDEIEDFMDKISLKCPSPKFSLGVKKNQVEVGDKRAVTVLQWACEYLNSQAEEEEDGDAE